MRAYLIGAFATLVLGGSAAAGSSECSRTLDGGWRCKEPDGHVTERRPDGEGGARTTSTDPRKWGTTDGHGRGITPPDSMIRNSPILRREAWGRVTDPWEPRKTPAPSPGGWRAPSLPGS
ncbi:hypothetical protein [Phenylobacterium sp. 58.2.17]|uniref:hypothetical protein n=1 Tax=Phenylobacterium sp. 58.2.17 TaxID=2969306 RepID=UPI002264EA70|nr:hypothetical protein [Phenylobacterium sp. 58.2.17]MCX7587209.1 hypothetical protein [Phenylobacterium sp. 58.2.17]